MSKRTKVHQSKMPTKRRKILDQKKNSYKYNLKLFYDLPQEIWYNHIIPPISRDWLFVSRKYHQLATKNLLLDQRIFNRITHPNSGPAYFGLAHKWKSESLLRLVLTLPYYNPADNNSGALRYAAGNGTINFVKTLLDDGRVDPLQALPAAVFPRDNIEMVKYLLQDSRIDPAANNNEVIRITVESGNWDYAELLIDDPRVDPSINDYFVLLEAVKYRRAANFIDKLIHHTKIDPSVNNNKALQLAQRYKNENIVEILMKDPVLQQDMNNDQVLVDFT